ncbi:MAG: TIGR00269 family protein [Nitrospirae bacterium]|nr:TIGR00269 family protein [Nitrospirota bacterium]
MRCKRCHAAPVAIKLPRHHTALCAACFDRYVVDQVERAIKHYRMFRRDEPVLVAVSGGKDSLGLWDLLQRMGYQTTGVHVQQGIGGYSGASEAKTRAFAEAKGLPLIVYDLNKEYGGGVTAIAETSRRSACSACGTVKRYAFNKIGRELGFPVVATGHNLDDEAARLLGNLLRWQVDYLAKQSPALPASHAKLIRKVKPLFRLTEQEVAAYAVLRKIDYVIDECPMSHDANSLQYKAALNQLEHQSPGTKQFFYLEFLRRQPIVGAESTAEAVVLNECARCGEPTTGELCGHCRLIAPLAQTHQTESGGRNNGRADPSIVSNIPMSVDWTA